MSSRGTKAVLALVAAAAGVLVFAWWRPADGPVPDVRLAPIDFDWGGVPVGSAERPGLDPLEAGPASRFPPSRLVRRPIPPEDAEKLFGIREREYDVFDPHCYFVKKPNQRGQREFPEHPAGVLERTTNSLGLRGSAEPAAATPDLRILVTGDSHTEGVCRDDETFAARLEARLRAAHPGRSIEVLNAARGGYCCFQYLGSLERLLALAPDVLVVGLYGGNDFEEILTLHHYFQGTQRPPSEPYRAQREAAIGVNGAAVGQALNGCRYFAEYPQEIDSSLQATRDCCGELVALCLRHSIQPVFVYLPPITDVETRFSSRLKQAIEVLGLTASDLRVHDRMADSLLTFLRQHGLDVLDMRPAFRAAPEPLYWKGELHMNLAAQELVTETLLAWVEGRGLAGRERVRAAPAPAR